VVCHMIWYGGLSHDLLLVLWFVTWSGMVVCHRKGNAVW